MTITMKNITMCRPFSIHCTVRYEFNIFSSHRILCDVGDAVDELLNFHLFSFRVCDGALDDGDNDFSMRSLHRIMMYTNGRKKNKALYCHRSIGDS